MLLAGVITALINSGFSGVAGWVAIVFFALSILFGVLFSPIYREDRAADKAIKKAVPIETAASAGFDSRLVALGQKLSANLVDTGYRVLVSPTAVTAVWDTGNVKFMSLLTHNNVRKTISNTLLLKGDRVTVLAKS